MKSILDNLASQLTVSLEFITALQLFICEGEKSFEDFFKTVILLSCYSAYFQAFNATHTGYMSLAESTL